MKKEVFKINCTSLLMNAPGKEYKTTFVTGRHKSEKDYDRKRDKGRWKKESVKYY